MRPWVYALAWGLLILLLTALPAPMVPGGGLLGRYHLDKLGHALLFGVFLVLLVRAFRSGRTREWKPRKVMVMAILLSVVHGGLTEWLQEFMAAGRRGELSDLVADIVGVILGTAYVRWGAGRMAYCRKRIERYF